MLTKEFAAKPSEARSSAKSGTKNLKSSNPKGSLLRAGGMGFWVEFRPPYKFWVKSVRIFSNAHRQFENAAFCTITRQHSPVGLRFLKTAQEPEKISARTSFLAKSRLPSFFNLIDFIKFVIIFMKG